MASAVQPKLPLSVDADTALEAVEAFDDTMYYSYRLIDKARTDFDTASFANTAKMAVLPGLCEKESALLESGVTVAFLYDDKDGHRIGAFSIGWRDCHK